MKICKKTIVQIIPLITVVLLGFCNTRCSALEMYPKSNLSLVNLGCGGMIPINGLAKKRSVLFNYVSLNTNKHGEKCLWTLDTSNNGTLGTRYSFKSKVTLLVSGAVDSHSGLSVVDWKSTDDDRDWVLSHHELTPSDPTYKSTKWDYNLYLSYSSQKGPATGFVLLVSIVDTKEKGPGSNFGFTTDTGNISYGIADDYDKFSMILSSPNPRTTLTVNSLTSKKNISSCSGYDSLDIYEIRVKNCPNRLVRMCGTIPYPVSYTSQYPLLATFYTSKTSKGKVGTKFQILWK